MDIFQHLNDLNPSPQGKEMNNCDCMRQVTCFQKEIVAVESMDPELEFCLFSKAG